MVIYTGRNVAIAVLAILVMLSLFYGLVGAQEVPTPGEEDCPAARQIEEFTETGEFTTDFIDTPTGQFYIFYEFPDAPTGDAQPLSVEFERESGGANAIADPSDNPDLEENQGQAKIEDVPGRYRFTFSPTDPDQEYVVTVFECGDPSGGESNNPKTTSQDKAKGQPAPPPPKATPPPAPKTEPKSQPKGPELKSGGSSGGPVPRMPNGGCPREYPVERGEGCFR